MRWRSDSRRRGSTLGGSRIWSEVEAGIRYRMNGAIVIIFSSWTVCGKSRYISRVIFLEVVDIVQHRLSLNIVTRFIYKA
jgi:hypothetical protein